MEDHQIAHICHEANRALQMEQNDPAIPVSPSWKDLDAEARASIIDGVQSVVGGADPQQSHENWIRFKHSHGWRLGLTKDPVAKTHPLLVPYAELPESQRLKDQLFGCIVAVLASY